MNWTRLIRNVRHPLAKYLRNPHHILKTLQWWWRPPKSSEQHIFVVGAPRSGTTLMQILIGNHESCVYDGETGVFKYRNVFEEQKEIFGLSRGFVEDAFERCGNIVDFFDICAEKFKEIEGGHYLVEKSPAHIFKTEFLVNHFTESHIVHIYRDGRDCFCSARSASIPHGESVSNYAHYWRSCIQSRLEVVSNRVLDVAYESLVENPEEELGRIMKAIDLSLDRQQLSLEQRATDPRAETEKFARLGEEISASSKGRWRKELDRTEILTFERIAGRQLKKLGYNLEIAK